MTSTEETIAALQAYFLASQRSLKERPQRLPYDGEGSISDKQELRQQRGLADPQRGYSQKQFDALIEQFRKADFAIGPAMMGRLVAMGDRSMRKQIITEAIANRWSKARIVAEMRRRDATVAPPHLGRTVTPVKDANDAIGRIIEHVPVWLGQLDAIMVGLLTESTSLWRHAVKSRNALAHLMKAADPKSQPSSPAAMKTPRDNRRQKKA